MDKRTRSDVEHAFIEFVDKVTELGFKFDMFTKIDLQYIKGDAASSPNNVHNMLSLRAEDFVQKEEKQVLKEDKG